MAHNVQGFISRANTLHNAASVLDATSVPLVQGFGFLPVTDTLVADSDAVPYRELHRLSSSLIHWAQRTSIDSPIAYIETCYHGGVGMQASMVWSHGRCVFGPLETLHGLCRDGEVIETPLLEGAINQALRHLGVSRDGFVDEFDALGLGRHRTNEGWLEAGGG